MVNPQRRMRLLPKLRTPVRFRSPAPVTSSLMGRDISSDVLAVMFATFRLHSPHFCTVHCRRSVAGCRVVLVGDSGERYLGCRSRGNRSGSPVLQGVLNQATTSTLDEDRRRDSVAAQREGSRLDVWSRWFLSVGGARDSTATRSRALVDDERQHGRLARHSRRHRRRLPGATQVVDE